jgi:hypothetical protein
VEGEAADATLRYTSFWQGRVLAKVDTTAGGSAERAYSDLAYEYHLTDHAERIRHRLWAIRGQRLSRAGTRCG